MEAGFAVSLDGFPESKGSYAASTRPSLAYGSQDTLAENGQAVTSHSSEVAKYETGSFNLAARLTVDPMTLFTGKSRPDRGGRGYLEAALLGWEDIPLYRDDRSRRLYVNTGVYLPTIGILDILRFQAELWPEPAKTNSFPGVYDGLEEIHGWRGQLYLSRALLPWFGVQGRVLRERTRRFQPGFFWTTGQPLPVKTGLWNSFEVRVVARL